MLVNFYIRPVTTGLCSWLRIQGNCMRFLHCSLQPHPGNCPRLSQRTMMKCHLEGSPSSLPPCAHTQVFSAAPSGVATSWTECSPERGVPRRQVGHRQWDISDLARFRIRSLDHSRSGAVRPKMAIPDVLEHCFQNSEWGGLQRLSQYTLEAAVFVWWCPSTNLVSGSAPYLAQHGERGCFAAVSCKLAIIKTTSDQQVLDPSLGLTRRDRSRGPITNLTWCRQKRAQWRPERKSQDAQALKRCD